MNKLNLISELNGIRHSVFFPLSLVNECVGNESLVWFKSIIDWANWTKPVSEASPLQCLWIFKRFYSAVLSLAFISLLSYVDNCFPSSDTTATFFILAYSCFASSSVGS